MSEEDLVEVEDKSASKGHTARPKRSTKARKSTRSRKKAKSQEPMLSVTVCDQLSSHKVAIKQILNETAIFLLARQNPEVDLASEIHQFFDTLESQERISPDGNASTEAPAITLGMHSEIVPLTEKESQQPFGDSEEETDDPFYTTISTQQAAKRLHVSRQTVNNWIKQGRLIGLNEEKRGWRIPAAQIKGRKIAPGLDMVGSYFNDPETTWHFLVHEQVFEDHQKSIRPLDILFARDIDKVVQLARGYGTDFL